MENSKCGQKREQLSLSMEQYQIILNQTTDIIFTWDIGKDTLTYSANWKKRFGYEPICSEISSWIPRSENIFADDMPAFVHIMEAARAGMPEVEAELRIRRQTGEFVWCRVHATTQHDASGRAVKAVGIIQDIDADKRQKEQLLEHSRRDGLTGLLNKTAAREAVDMLLHCIQQEPGVLLIIDLDHFKEINDRYGHLAGDTVLSNVASTLRRFFRINDVAARIGGDEFLIYMPGASRTVAEKKAFDLIKSLKETEVFARRGFVSCSIGAAVYPEDGDAFDGLFRCADLALYRVKNGGRGDICFYAAGLDRKEPSDETVHSAVNMVIDSSVNEVNETVTQYCFKMLYHAIKPQKAVQQMIEIVGRAYDVSRVYIFENSEDGCFCSNTFEWCNEGVSPEIDSLQNISYKAELKNYQNNFDRNGIFYCEDVRQLKPVVYEIVERQSIRSMLQCAIVDDGQFSGYVGFDECRENRHWTKEQVDTLSFVANVLSTFLMKLRYKERLKALCTQQGLLPGGLKNGEEQEKNSLQDGGKRLK